MTEHNLVPFGLHIETNKLVTISEVDKGKKCNCICPSCDIKLIARQGKKNEWHFAHDTDLTNSEIEEKCKYSFYVSVRLMIHQLVENLDNIEINLPEYSDSIAESSKTENFVITKLQKILLTNLNIRFSCLNTTVDIFGKVKDYNFVIYITHPSRPLPFEFNPKNLENKKYGIIEISLNNLAIDKRNFIDSSYRKILIDFLLNDDKSKKWIFHPNYKVKKELAEKKLKETLYSKKSITSGIVNFQCQNCYSKWQGCNELLNYLCPNSKCQKGIGIILKK
jgi:hypothetical protein